jgi:hypothetical protein
MLKRAIRFVESTQERDCWNLNLNKTEFLAALRWTHDEIMDGPPLPPDRPHPFDDDHEPTTTMWWTRKYSNWSGSP